MLKARIAVLVSGGGTNLQALIDAQKAWESSKAAKSSWWLPATTRLTPQRAAAAGIETAVASKKELGSQSRFEEALCALMSENDIDLIVMAGFMSILTKDFTDKYPMRIINIHPSLIPSFCGKGFYGIHVHEGCAGIRSKGDGKPPFTTSTKYLTAAA